MSNDFNWRGSDEESSVIFQTVQAIAVYTNTAGDIVVRQEGLMGDSDSVVVIPRAQADAVSKAIKLESKKPLLPSDRG